VRPRSNISSLQKIACKIIQLDYNSPSKLRKALYQVTILYHLAGALPNQPISDADYFSANADLVQKIMQSARRVKTIRQFIHASTAFVCWNKELYANEQTAAQPETIYERSKYRGEQYALEMMGKVPFQITIVRPGFVYGTGNKGLLVVSKLVKYGVTGIFGAGNHLFELIHISDVVRFLVLISGNPKAANQVFLVSEKHPQTFKHLISELAALLHVPTPHFFLPETIGKIFFAGLVQTNKILPMPITFSDQTYKMLYCDRAFTTAKAESMLGFIARKPVKVGLQEVIQDYEQQGWI